MWVDGLFVALIIANLILLGTTRLSYSIKVVAVQGVLLAPLPMLGVEAMHVSRALFLVIVTAALKGGVFPALLMRSMREASVRREMEPMLGFTASLALGVAMLAASFWMGGRMQELGLAVSPISMASVLFMMFTGILLLTARRKALTQVLGFLVLENGIYGFGLLVAGSVHWLVELGVLLDVFVAVFVMGIAVYHINREFDHMNVDELDRLRG